MHLPLILRVVALEYPTKNPEGDISLYGINRLKGMPLRGILRKGLELGPEREKP